MLDNIEAALKQMVTEIEKMEETSHYDIKPKVSAFKILSQALANPEK